MPQLQLPGIGGGGGGGPRAPRLGGTGISRPSLISPATTPRQPLPRPRSVIPEGETTRLPSQSRDGRPVDYRNLSDQARNIFGKNDGRIRRVRFLKRTTGGLRDMLARTPVPSYARKTNRGRPYDPDAHGLIEVWDVQKGDYRMIPAANVVEIRDAGRVLRRRRDQVPTVNRQYAKDWQKRPYYLPGEGPLDDRDPKARYYIEDGDEAVLFRASTVPLVEHVRGIREQTGLDELSALEVALNTPVRQPRRVVGQGGQNFAKGEDSAEEVQRKLASARHVKGLRPVRRKVGAGLLSTVAGRERSVRGPVVQGVPRDRREELRQRLESATERLDAGMAASRAKPVAQSVIEDQVFEPGSGPVRVPDHSMIVDTTGKQVDVRSKDPETLRSQLASRIPTNTKAAETVETNRRLARIADEMTASVNPANAVAETPEERLERMGRARKSQGFSLDDQQFALRDRNLSADQIRDNVTLPLRRVAFLRSRMSSGKGPGLSRRPLFNPPLDDEFSSLIERERAGVRRTLRGDDQQFSNGAILPSWQRLADTASHYNPFKTYSVARKAGHGRVRSALISGAGHVSDMVNPLAGPANVRRIRQELQDGQQFDREEDELQRRRDAIPEEDRAAVARGARAMRDTMGDTFSGRGQRPQRHALAPGGGPRPDRYYGLPGEDTGVPGNRRRSIAGKGDRVERSRAAKMRRRESISRNIAATNAPLPQRAPQVAGGAPPRLRRNVNESTRSVATLLGTTTAGRGIENTIQGIRPQSPYASTQPPRIGGVMPGAAVGRGGAGAQPPPYGMGVPAGGSDEEVRAARRAAVSAAGPRTSPIDEIDSDIAAAIAARQGQSLGLPTGNEERRRAVGINRARDAGDGQQAYGPPTPRRFQPSAQKVGMPGATDLAAIARGSRGVYDALYPRQRSVAGAPNPSGVELIPGASSVELERPSGIRQSRTLGDPSALEYDPLPGANVPRRRIGGIGNIDRLALDANIRRNAAGLGLNRRGQLVELQKRGGIAGLIARMRQRQGLLGGLARAVGDASGIRNEYVAGRVVGNRLQRRAINQRPRNIALRTFYAESIDERSIAA